MTSSTSEHGTPVKKSKPWRVSSVATSWPEITRRLAQRHSVAAHHSEELAERGEPHEGVLTLLVADRGKRATVVVAGKQQRVVGQRAQTLGERVVHLARIAARQVGPPARADEQRVAGDEAAVDEKTLRARRVPRRGRERRREPSDAERVVTVDLHEVRAEAGEELTLGLVDVNLERNAREQLLDAGDAAGHAPRCQASADVILMRVRDQSPG